MSGSVGGSVGEGWSGERFDNGWGGVRVGGDSWGRVGNSWGGERFNDGWGSSNGESWSSGVRDSGESWGSRVGNSWGGVDGWGNSDGWSSERFNSYGSWGRVSDGWGSRVGNSWGSVSRGKEWSSDRNSVGVGVRGGDWDSGL